jgi:prevent-host-death family protein
MKSVGIRKAKPCLSALVRAAAGGETTLITDYGKPVAVIAPIEARAADLPEPEGDTTKQPEPRQPTDSAAFLDALFNPPFRIDLDF